MQELKNLLWLNYCKDEFESLDRSSIEYQDRLNIIRSKSLLAIESDLTNDFKPFKQLIDNSKKRISINIEKIEKSLSTTNNILHGYKKHYLSN